MKRQVILACIFACALNQTSHVEAEPSALSNQKTRQGSPTRTLGPREVPQVNAAASNVRGLPPLSPDKEQELIQRCLMIIHPSVVDDARAQGTGPWSFGGLITEIANKPTTGIEPLALAESWIQEVKGGFTGNALKAWDQLSGGMRKLDKLPFRLLAIVNRIDLRNNLVLGGTGAGELRFVFGLHDGDGKPIDATVIFEFNVKRTTLNEVRAWGREWYQLRNVDHAKPEFNSLLQQITDQYTLRNADVESPPNRSALGQIRVSISEGKNWRFAEFKVDVQNSGMLVQVTAKQTPQLNFNNSETINQFLRAFQADIVKSRHQVPVKFGGIDFLTKDSNLPAGRPPKFFWNGSKLPDDLLEARHLFSLGTCSGCHARETDTDFFHVGNRNNGVAAPLSQFLKGNRVSDPAGQLAESDPTKPKIREFNDLHQRAEDLRRLVELGAAYESSRVPLNMVH